MLRHKSIASSLNGSHGEKSNAVNNLNLCPLRTVPNNAQFAPLDDCGYGIDLRGLNSSEKLYIIRAMKWVSGQKCSEASKYAHKLLKLKPNSAAYNYLASQIYYDWAIEGYSYPDKDPIFTAKHKHFLQKALKIEPNHPVFLTHVACSFWDQIDGRSAIIHWNKLHLLLKDPKYLQKYKFAFDIHKFECHFQWQYVLSLQRMNDYHRLSNTLDELYPRYVQIVEQIEDVSHRWVKCIANVYMGWFCHQGRYRKAYEAFQLQHIAYSQNIDDCLQNATTFFMMFVALEKYTEAEQYIQHILQNYDKIKEPQKYHGICAAIILYSYLCYIFAENKRFKSIKMIDEMYSKLTEMDGDHKDHMINDSVLFFKACMLYLLLRHRDCLDEKYNGVIEFLLSTIHGEIKLMIFDSFFHFVLGKVFYLLRLELGGGLVITIKQFVCCLCSSIAFASDTRKYVDRPCIGEAGYFVLTPFIKVDIPFSYYYLGLITLKSKQYQIAIKLLRSAKKLGKDATLIKYNCDGFIVQAKRMWKGQECVNCGKQTKTLKSCKGCGSAFYCSHLCQKVHWKAQHRDECTKLWEELMIVSDYPFKMSERFYERSHMDVINTKWFC
eukprot:110549_1